MGIMMYDPEEGPVPIGFTAFVGARSFRSWENAIAYALLPDDPKVFKTPLRRRVSRASSGRWVVIRTWVCRNPWHRTAPARQCMRCPECP